MAAPAENLLSPGHRTGTKENTFTKQREQRVKRSRAMQLQQRLQELKDKERQAQRHNKQLLQQFEKAQDALKEMLACNAAMKTIRMEYERYLEENSPHWQQQLQEKTQAAQKKRMGDCLRSYLEKTDEKEVLTSTIDGPLLSQGSQKCVAPQENSDYNQNSSSHRPFTQSSWLTSTQTHTGRFPGFLTAPHQSHNPFLFPLPNPLHPHSFLLQHLTSSPGQCQPWSGQDAAGWDSSQHNDPSHWTAAIPSGSLGQLHTALRVSQTVGEEDETSRSPNSNRKDGGSGSSLSPDLDVKPVRLFSSHAGSSESGRDSSLACMEKRKKRGRTQHLSSDSERSDSQKASRTSSKIVVASLTPAQSSETNSSEESSSRSSRKTKRGGGGGLFVKTSQPEEGAKEETRRKEDKKSLNTDENEGSLSENVANQSHGDKSKNSEAEEQGKNMKTQTRAKEETDVQEGSSSEQSCIEEKDEEDIQETGDEEENSQKSEKQVSDLEEDDVSTRKRTSEEEEESEDQGDEEQLNLKNKNAEIKKEESASSQDEDEDGSECSEDKTNEEEEGSNKEEDSSEEEEESGDSEDIIVPPQEKRSKQMLVISEEAAEDDDDDSKTQSSNEYSDEDIENLLAPLEQTKKEQRDVKADDEPKAVCQNMNMVEVTEVKSKTNRQSDSDEFDHFYD